jgi:hypothetical protein
LHALELPFLRLWNKLLHLLLTWHLR